MADGDVLSNLDALAAIVPADLLLYVMDLAEPILADRSKKLEFPLLLAYNDARYATVAQGVLADSALQSATLAQVAGFSATTPQQTFALNTGTQLIFEQAGGDDIALFYEANKGAQFKGHTAIGALAEIDESTTYYAGQPISVLMMFEEEFTNMADPWYSSGFFNIITLNPSEDNFNYGYGAVIEAHFKAGNANDAGGISGLYGAAVHHGSGHLFNVAGMEYYGIMDTAGGSTDDLYGLATGAIQFGSGAITNAYGLRILGGTGAGITNQYGIYINNQASGAAAFALVTNAGNVVLNEGSNNTMKLRVEGATDINLLVTDGPNDAVAIGAASRSDTAKLYVAGKISTSGEMEINGDLNHDGSNIGLFSTAPTTKKTVTGSRGGNAALASLLTQLAAYGLITDSTSA